MDTGEKLINIRQLADNYSQELIVAMLALHAFTGADCTSTFKGKGKVKPMKLLSQNAKFIHIFAAVGFTWTLDDDHIVNGIEEFTCRLYGVGPRVKQVDVAREIKVKNICGSNVDLRPGLSIDLSIFPQCRRVLAQHIKRVSISKFVSGAVVSIIFQKYRPFLTMVIMSQKRENRKHFGSRGTSFRWFKVIF